VKRATTEIDERTIAKLRTDARTRAVKVRTPSKER
jgi:hypothetical protein